MIHFVLHDAKDTVAVVVVEGVKAGMALDGWIMDDDATTLLRRRAVGFVFQAFHVLPYLTVEQNIALPLELLGFAPAERVRRTAEMMEAVGVAALARRHARELSGGEVQRIAIARALVHKPRLVLADEPTGNLDAETGRHVIDLLFGLARDNGTTLILITHDPALAESCDRILRMGDGRLVEDRPALASQAMLAASR